MFYTFYLIQTGPSGPVARVRCSAGRIPETGIEWPLRYAGRGPANPCLQRVFHPGEKSRVGKGQNDRDPPKAKCRWLNGASTTHGRPGRGRIGGDWLASLFFLLLNQLRTGDPPPKNSSAVPKNPMGTEFPKTTPGIQGSSNPGRPEERGHTRAVDGGRGRRAGTLGGPAGNYGNCKGPALHRMAWHSAPETLYRIADGGRRARASGHLTQRFRAPFTRWPEPMRSLDKGGGGGGGGGGPPPGRAFGVWGGEVFFFWGGGGGGGGGGGADKQKNTGR